MSEADPSQWGCKPSAAASAHGQCTNNVFSVTTASNDNSWTRKSPPECESPPKRKTPPEDLDALEQLQQAHHIFMPYEDRHSQQKPCWYLEASCEPRQMNTQNQAIGHGSFFKCRAYDYTDNKLNLPQGHKDCVCTVDLLPADRQRCEQNDDDSVLPSDWL
jgi:hypothetical protein